MQGGGEEYEGREEFGGPVDPDVSPGLRAGGPYEQGGNVPPLILGPFRRRAPGSVGEGPGAEDPGQQGRARPPPRRS